MIVAGLDLSLTSTGICVMAGDPAVPGPPTVHVGVAGSKAAGDDLGPRADRLTDLAAQIVAAVQNADLICVERPAYSSTTGQATDRAGLFWLVCARLIRGYRIPVVDIVNNHLKMYATGKGTGSKAVVVSEVARRFDTTFGTDDEADAFVLAAMAWHRATGTPVKPIPQTHARALAAVKWPSNTPTHHP